MPWCGLGDASEVVVEFGGAQWLGAASGRVAGLGAAIPVGFRGVDLGRDGAAAQLGFRYQMPRVSARRVALGGGFVCGWGSFPLSTGARQKINPSVFSRTQVDSGACFDRLTTGHKSPFVEMSPHVIVAYGQPHFVGVQVGKDLNAY